MKNRHRGPISLHNWQLWLPAFILDVQRELLRLQWVGYWRRRGERKGRTDPSQCIPVLSSVYDCACASPFILLPHLVLKQIHVPSFGYPNGPCLGQRLPLLWLSVAFHISDWWGAAVVQDSSLRQDPPATQVPEARTSLKNGVLTTARSKKPIVFLRQNNQFERTTSKIEK